MEIWRAAANRPLPIAGRGRYTDSSTYSSANRSTYSSANRSTYSSTDSSTDSGSHFRTY